MSEREKIIEAGEVRDVFVDKGVKLDDLFFPIIFTYLGYRIYVLEITKHNVGDGAFYTVALMIEGNGITTPVFYLVVDNTEEFVEKVVKEVEKIDRTIQVLGKEFLEKAFAQLRHVMLKIMPSSETAPTRRYRRRTREQEFKPE